MYRRGAEKGTSSVRLALYYAFLAAAVAVVAIIVVGKGEDKKAQPSIAGGYDVAAPNACLGAPPAPAKGRKLPATAPPQPLVGGPSFDVKQSGQFVNLSNTQDTLGGKLRLKEHPRPDGSRTLTGDVDCVNGKTQHFDGNATPGNKGTIAGELGGRPVLAALKRDPPDAGTPKPRVPGSVAGLYKLSPRSTCFGGKFKLAGSGSSYTVKAGEQKLGKLAYDDDKGTLSGDLACTKGGSVKAKGAAVDRNINNLQLIPLDTAAASPAKSVSGKPIMTTPTGLGPAGEKLTATKQRDSFGKSVAAF